VDVERKIRLSKAEKLLEVDKFPQVESAPSLKRKELSFSKIGSVEKAE
jgi:hypothetical protein